MALSYNLDRDFERLLAVMCSSAPKSFSTIVQVLDPEALQDPACQRIVKAARLIFKETGRGPSNPAIVMQRLRRVFISGKLTQEDLEDVQDVFIETPSVPAQDVLDEIVPVLRRAQEAAIVKASMAEYARHGDFAEIRKQLELNEQIGRTDKSKGVRLGREAFQRIAALKRVIKATSGIPELDVVLGGGFGKGRFIGFVARTGGGKSMMLSHVIGANLMNGTHGAVATLEVGEEEWTARVIANLTGKLITDIVNGEANGAEEELDRLYSVLGSLDVKTFTAGSTTPYDIFEWVDSLEQEYGYEIPCLAVDYLEKLHSPDRRDDNTYKAQGTTTEQLRVYAQDRGKWVFSASQPKNAAGKERKRRLGLGDAADSKRKEDVADYWITINQESEESDLLTYHVAKDRHGSAAGSVVGPFPHDWAVGSMIVRGR